MRAGVKPIRMRGGAGVGDSIYLRPIAEHFAASGMGVTVLSDYPDIFIGAAGVHVEPFTRQGVTVLAHYATRRESAFTQFEDMCRAAQIEPVPLRFDWPVRNATLTAEAARRARGRPIVIVHGGREPFGRTDGLGLRMVPDRGAFDAALAALRGCFTVGIGKADRIYDIPVEWDLHGQTTVSDLLDLGHAADGVLAQCSFAVPLAEVFDKPLLTVWSAAGIAAPGIIGQVTPQKILHKATSTYVMDSWRPEEITAFAATRFRTAMNEALVA